jgi:hypothetical protein
MQQLGCAHEQDVLDLTLTGRWPASADTALAAHVLRCDICANAAHTGLALSVLDDESNTMVSVPEAERIWFGVKIRARDDAVRRVGRPLLVVETAAAILAAAVAAWWGFDRTWPNAAYGWLQDLKWGRAAVAGSAESAWQVARWLVTGLGASAALLSVALYIALVADRDPHDRRKTSPMA